MGTKDQLFPSRFFKPVDFPSPRTLKIADCNLELMQGKDGKSQEKLTIGFVGERKRLVVNRGNFDRLVDITGAPDWDGWFNHRVTLFANRELAFGVMTDCLRVRAPDAAPPKKAAVVIPKAPPPKTTNGTVNAVSSGEEEPPPHEHSR
jgi:hypothetical protein